MDNEQVKFDTLSKRVRELGSRVQQERGRATSARERREAILKANGVSSIEELRAKRDKSKEEFDKMVTEANKYVSETTRILEEIDKVKEGV